MLRAVLRFSIAFCVGSFFACSTLAAQAQSTPQPVAAIAAIKDATGRTIATAELKEDSGKVAVALILSTPSPLSGKHGLHIMDVGRCDPPDFASAGGIFNPYGKKHGLLATGGPMAGDLPNLALPLQRYNAPALGASLGTGQGSLLTGRGTALVIFANDDDGLTDPEGNAGPRIACGVITASGPAAAADGLAQPNGGSNPGSTLAPALLILLLGAALIGAGMFLRRARPRT